MKRSERLKRDSRHKALMAAMIFCVCIAGCVWSVALIDPLPSGGMLAAAAGAAGLSLAARMWRDALRTARLGRIEKEWEYSREVRPRL